jgi:hypothetical protein
VVRGITVSVRESSVRLPRVLAEGPTKDPKDPNDPAGGGGAVMLSGEMARYQIGDRVREAEAERLARSTRRSRAADSRGVTRRIGRAALAAATWPIKH